MAHVDLNRATSSWCTVDFSLIPVTTSPTPMRNSEPTKFTDSRFSVVRSARRKHHSRNKLQKFIVCFNSRTWIFRCTPQGQLLVSRPCNGVRRSSALYHSQLRTLFYLTDRPCQLRRAMGSGIPANWLRSYFPSPARNCSCPDRYSCSNQVS